jgi:hypothetical protein
VIKRFFVFFLCLILALLPCSDRVEDNRYWIWAGLLAEQAPPTAILYIYQGAWVNHCFYRKGIFPSKISQKKVYLVYRIEGELPAPERVANLFMTHCRRWDKQGVHVIGLQIDYDSPSKKLNNYYDFLKNLQQLLLPFYRLSITALCDWLVSGDQETLNDIGSVTQEIVFQLYHHNHYIPQIAQYTAKLRLKRFYYRLGFLSKNAPVAEIDKFLCPPYYQGRIIFIQKTT